MQEIKIRYTWKRGSDGNIIQRIVDLRSLEEKGLILDFSGYRLIARDLWTEYVDAEGNEIYNGDRVLVPNKTGDYIAEVFRSSFGGWEICPNRSKLNDNASMVMAKKSKVIGNVHLKQQ